MSHKNLYLAGFVILAVIIACGRSGKKNTSDTGNLSEYTIALPEKKVDTTESTYDLPDMSRDVDSMSVQELRLLRSSIYARYGYLFLEADLRGYFSAHMKNYDSLMYDRWENNMDDESNRPEKIKLSQEEQTLVDKIDVLLGRHLKQNYVERDGYRIVRL